MRRKLALALLAMVVAALAAEGGYRGWRWLAGAPYDSVATEALIGELAAGADRSLRLPGDVKTESARATADSIVLHPYVGYDRRSSVDGVPSLRRSQLDQPDRYDVLILGGSVAEIFGDSGAGRLGELLAEDPRLGGRPVRFLKFARTTYKAPQQELMFAYLLAMGLRPDAVLLIDGFNEVAETAYNQTLGVHPLHPLRDIWLSVATLGPDGAGSAVEYARLVEARTALESAADSVSRYGLSRSAILGTVALGQLRGRKRALLAQIERYVAQLVDHDLNRELLGPPFDGDLDDAVRLGVESWAQGSLSIHAMCEARSIAFLHVLQPTLHDEGSKPMTDDERANAGLAGPWLLGAQAGYPLLREAALRLQAQGVHVFDATRVFVDVQETIYRDACHFDERGNRILAEAVAVAFQEALPASLRARAPAFVLDSAK